MTLFKEGDSVGKTNLPWGSLKTSIAKHNNKHLQIHLNIMSRKWRMRNEEIERKKKMVIICANTLKLFKLSKLIWRWRYVSMIIKI